MSAGGQGAERSARSRDTRFLSIREVAAGYRSGEFTPVDVVERCLELIHALDGELHSFLTVIEDQALRGARAATQELQAGDSRSPLHGIPVGLKDIFPTKGVPTTAHSRVLRNWIPSHDAAAWQLLGAAGAILLGKLALHEFACGFDTEVPFPLARNPWDLSRLPGGSSSGSAAAVAAGLCFASLVSDTGGSSRIPASYCGVVGLKPTYGRISRRGLLPLSWSLDHVGIIARTVGDCAVVLQATAGADPHDRTSSSVSVPVYDSEMAGAIDGVRVGVPWENWLDDGSVHPEIEQLFNAATHRLAELGAEIIPIDGRPFGEAHTVQSILLHCEGYAAHEERLRNNYALYGPRLRQRLLTGMFLSSADYLQATRARTHLVRTINGLFDTVDVIATPTQGQPPERLQGFDPDQHFNRLFTSPFNLTGAPALSVPCGFTRDGLPVGLQLATRPFSEGDLLRVAAAYEAATPWHDRHPSLSHD